jgi:hypothetical protein
MFINLKLNKKGQSMFEAILAIAIFTVGVVGFARLTLGGLDASRGGQERAEALMLAREGLAAVRSIRDNDYDNLVNGTYGLSLNSNSNRWEFSGTSDTTGDYKRIIEIGDVVTTTIDLTDIKVVTSSVVWDLGSDRTITTTLTDYLTDWQQTHGHAGELSVDMSNVVLKAGQADKVIGDITIKNTSSTDVRIDTMTLWWNNTNDLTRIRIDNSNIYNDNTGAPSGTELDVTDTTLANSDGDVTIDQLRWDDTMTGTNFVMMFRMSDTSTHYVYFVEPGTESAAGDADNLNVITTAVGLDPSDNTKIVGIDLENTGGSAITLDAMTVSWTGGTSGSKINEIKIDGVVVWTGTASSGGDLDITDVIISAGATIDIDWLDFSKNMTGSNLTIVFTMSDASEKTESNITP